MLSPLSRGLPPPRSQWELLEVGGRGADRSLCSSCPHRTHPPSHPRSRSRGGGIKPQSGGGWATEDPDCTPPNGAPREGVYDPLRPPTKGSNTPLRRLCGCGGAQKRAAIAQLPPHHGGVRAFRAPHRTAPRGSTAGGSEPKGAELLRGGGMGPPWAEPHQSRGGGVGRVRPPSAQPCSPPSAPFNGGSARDRPGRIARCAAEQRGENKVLPQLLGGSERSVQTTPTVGRLGGQC